MKQKIRQILYDMRRQPLISGVTFIATVLSVFLFMVVVITSRVKTVPFPPESCRDRLLVGKFMHIKKADTNGDSSSGLSHEAAKILYQDLKGVERTSFMADGTWDAMVKGTLSETIDVKGRTVDAEFFRIFDHPLLDGRYFTADEANEGLPVVVISEKTARGAFGKTDVAGMPISLNHMKYTVLGVVKDNSALATTASGDVFYPYSPKNFTPWGESKMDHMFGNTTVALLVKDGVDFQSVRDQVKGRYAELNTKFRADGMEVIYHESPYDQEVLSSNLFGSNSTPDTSGDRMMRYILYAILLLVPAINLSSLLHSRMHKRVSEIGVRRAFGCTRTRIITDIIWENFLITLVGGIVGVGLGIVFAMTYSGLYENMNNYGTGATPAVSAVINWGTVLIAIAVCFILNIISASIPAWQASRLNPVEAINNK